MVCYMIFCYCFCCCRLWCSCSCSYSCSAVFSLLLALLLFLFFFISLPSSFLFRFDSNHQLYHFSRNLLTHSIFYVFIIQTILNEWMNEWMILLLYIILFDLRILFMPKRFYFGFVKMFGLNQLYYCFFPSPFDYSIFFLPALNVCPFYSTTNDA